MYACLKPHDPDAKKGWLDRFFEKFNGWFERVTGKYKNAVDWNLKNARYAVIVLVCIIVGVVLLFKNKPSGFIPLEDDGRLYITYDIPEGASTQRTVADLQGMMKILSKTPGILHYAALGGLNVVSFASKANSATIFVQLKPWDERTADSLQIGAITANLQQKLAKFKEASVVVIQPPAIPGLGSTGGFSFILEQKEAGGDIREFEKPSETLPWPLTKGPKLPRPSLFSPPVHQPIN